MTDHLLKGNLVVVYADDGVTSLFVGRVTAGSILTETNKPALLVGLNAKDFTVDLTVDSAPPLT